jgi:hypothetical protein
MKIMVVMAIMIKCLACKRRKRKQKAQGKGMSGYELFGLVIETLSECDHI